MSHLAAQTTQLMSEIIASVKEIPKGVVNIFSESGAEGAKLLVSSTQVKVVSFTGSTATGRAIAKAAAGTFKRVGLEFKASGAGRLGGTASLDDFLEYKQITQNFVPPDRR